MTKYVASDEFIARMESMSAMLTKIRTKYGSVTSLVEHPNWDDNRTMHAARLVHALLHNLHSIDEELTNHVNERFG